MNMVSHLSGSEDFGMVLRFSSLHTGLWLSVPLDVAKWSTSFSAIKNTAVAQ